MFSGTLGVVLSSFKMTTILKGMRRYSLFLVLFFYSSRDWEDQIRLSFFPVSESPMTVSSSGRRRKLKTVHVRENEREEREPTREWIRKGAELALISKLLWGMIWLLLVRLCSLPPNTDTLRINYPTFGLLGHTSKSLYPQISGKPMKADLHSHPICLPLGRTRITFF